MTPEAARALLDVTAEASTEEVRRASRARSRMMHPDRFAGRPESEVRLATAGFERLDRAYRVLLDPEPASADATGEPPRAWRAYTLAGEV